MNDGGRAVPTGTVSFLFSDVVASTRLWAADPSGMASSLRRHDEVFIARSAEHHGYVFSTAGDSFAIAFARASDAGACALAILADLTATDWGDGPVLAVRVGLHVGEAEERDGNYFGATVNLAARVMSAAYGGQCLVTRAVTDLIGSDVLDLGECHLRDIDAPVHLLQLGTGSFPPLRTAGSGIVALPSPRTSLVGREEDVAALRRLLADHRLLTLTGVGGCGKTRLAIEVARQEVATFPEGVWFVDLSTIADEDAIFGVFAAALQVVIPDRDAAIEALTVYLAPREALLVIDNCEHVIDEAAELVDRLLARCPRLRILATSRESLELDGERAWKVPSLAAERGGAAVELFVERASSAGAPPPDDPESVTAIVDIVAHLDGVPLAIELAAARTRSMSVTEIRDRLDDRFRILSGGKRRSRQRQATLEAAVQWSYDLLDDSERSTLQQLAVFQGGFDVRDACAVIEFDDATVVDLIDSLVAKSLIDVTRDARGAFRHRLLETIRLFGLSKLVESGSADAVRDRHLDHFVDDPIMRTMGDWLSIDALWRIDREYENFRAAAEWAIERDRTDATAMIAACMSDAAPPRGDTAVVIEWMGAPSDLRGRDRVFVQALLGHALNVTGRVDLAMEFLPAAVEAGDALGCEDAIFAWLDIGVAAGYSDLGEQRRVYDDASRRAEERFGGSNITACAAMFTMMHANYLGEYERVLELVDAGAEQWDGFGYTHIVEAQHAYALLRLGRREAAHARVATFSTVPPSSQWGHMNLSVEHVVLADAMGGEAALRALAPRAAESFARRPLVAADLFITFALLETELGRPESAAQAVDLQTIATGTTMADLITLRAGIPLGERRGRRRALDEATERLGPDERWRNNRTAPALLAAAIARWS